MTKHFDEYADREQVLAREQELQAEIDELRAALKAQPVQEPFAHICILPTKDAGPTKFFTAPSDPRGFPVYRAAPVQPVQPAPLTGEQITEAAKSLGIGSYQTLAAAFKAGVKFAESTNQNLLAVTGQTTALKL